MMDSLAATFGVNAVLAGLLGTLGMAAQFLEPGRRPRAPAGLRRSLGLFSVRPRFGSSINERQPEGRYGPPGIAVGHGTAYQPERAGGADEEPRSAEILPFPRKPASRPQPPPDWPPPSQPLLVAAWRRRRNENGKQTLELCWSLAPRLLDRAEANHRGGSRRDIAHPLTERMR